MIKIYCNDNLKKVLKDNNVENYSPAYEGESVGLDLYNSGEDIIIHTTENTKMKPNSSFYNKTLIPTGLHVIIPKGHVALIKERGSITKTMLSARAGVIDPGYTGEIFVNLINHSSNSGHTIEKGSKLPVQLVVLRCNQFFEEIREEEYLSLTSNDLRKKGQIGSSD